MRFIVLIILLVFYTTLSGQTPTSVGVSITLPSIAVLDVEPNRNGITLSMVAPTEAGSAVVNTQSDNSKWLNFSSAVTIGQTRRITAQLSGTLPNGVNLKLTTAAYSGSGAGALGTQVSPILLNSTAQTIINNIGGAYTGNGANNGYNLGFSLEIQDYSLLRQQTSTISIVYTLVDN